jgi:transaldolase
VLPTDGGDAEDVLAEFTRQGVNDETLAANLQSEGIRSFEKSWNDLLACVASKTDVVKKRSVQASNEMTVI